MACRAAARASASAAWAACARGLAGQLGAGGFQAGGGLGADCLDLGLGGFRAGGGGQLSAHLAQLAEHAFELAGQRCDGGQHVIADARGPRDGGGDWPASAVMAASTSSRMPVARAMAAVT